MDLQIISQAVARHQAQVIDTSEGRQKRLARWGGITSLIGVAMLTPLVIRVLIGPFIDKNLGVGSDVFGFDLMAPLILFIGLLVIVIGAGLASYPKVTKKLRSLGSAELLTAAQRNRELNSNRQARSEYHYHRRRQKPK